ncbi:MAG: lysophospholipid acyltransferase family protein [candidate division WOR-3 bacterium]
MKISELLLQNNLFIRTVQGIFEIVYYFYIKTIKFKQIGNLPEKKALFCFWHRTFFPLIYFYRNKKIRILISTSRDGELLIKPLKKFRFIPVRGSSSKLGEKGFRQMIKALKKEKLAAITPDGPKGPRETFKEGALFISYLSKAPIYLVGVAFNRKIELSSWDRFMIPLPFSKCTVYISSPIFVYNKKMIDSELFTNLLKEANEIAQKNLKRR